MKMNQRGAIDMMLVVALVIVLAVGGLVILRISEGDSDDKAKKESKALVENEEKDGDEVEATEQQDSDAQYPASLVSYLDEELEATIQSCENVENPELYDEATYTIDQVIDGRYASVTGTGCTEASGLSSLYVLENDEWVSISSRVGPLCVDLEQYEFPSGIVFNEGELDQCRDESNQFVEYPRQVNAS